MMLHLSTTRSTVLNERTLLSVPLCRNGNTKLLDIRFLLQKVEDSTSQKVFLQIVKNGDEIFTHKKKIKQKTSEKFCVTFQGLAAL